MRRGIFGGTTTPLTPRATDTKEVVQLLGDPEFAEHVRALAREIDRSDGDVLAEAVGHLRHMAASHARRAERLWSGFGRWLLRSHDLVVDEAAVRGLRKLDRGHSLVLLPSHRSYLDTWLLPEVLTAQAISPSFGMGGANLDFFPFGTLARRTGVVFIERSTKEAPVYRLALRSYIGQLLRNGENLGWSIEGGRTRTGKLRPPVYGIMRYVVDAIEATDGPEVLAVPISIVYDNLHEVALMTAEARGSRKQPENLGWLVGFARSERHSFGRAYVNVGQPLPLRQRLAELRADDGAGRAVERIALECCHRINRATPVTTTAVACLALLAADRALTLDDVLNTISPLAGYIAARGWSVAGAADLTDRATIRRALGEMVRSGVLTAYDGGTETVWSIAPGQHLVAAFYRNTTAHMLVDRAIGEVALAAAAERHESDARVTLWDQARRLRDLLKFEFFFARLRDFVVELRAELQLLDPHGVEKVDSGIRSLDAAKLLQQARPHLAHLVLRPFLDAYLIVAEQLADNTDDELDEARFLDECLRVGKQWALQRRIASEESVSLELFKPALRLARHRGLDSAAPDVKERRRAFADELCETIRLVGGIADLAGGAAARAPAHDARTGSTT